MPPAAAAVAAPVPPKAEGSGSVPRWLSCEQGRGRRGGAVDDGAELGGEAGRREGRGGGTVVLCGGVGWVCCLRCAGPIWAHSRPNLGSFQAGRAAVVLTWRDGGTGDGGSGAGACSGWCYCMSA
jgi:hypothetical protein